MEDPRLAAQRDGYWGGVMPPAHDEQPTAAQEMLDAHVAKLAEPEVKYEPNRAERRAREKQIKRLERRATRAGDRAIEEMRASMTRAEVDAAMRLAAKSLGRG